MFNKCWLVFAEPMARCCAVLSHHPIRTSTHYSAFRIFHWQLFLFGIHCRRISINHIKVDEIKFYVAFQMHDDMPHYAKHWWILPEGEFTSFSLFNDISRKHLIFFPSFVCSLCSSLSLSLFAWILLWETLFFDSTLRNHIFHRMTI